MSEELKPPPHSNNAEHAVLGAMMIDNAIIPEVMAMLDETAFYTTANRRVFGVMHGMWQLGDEAIDQVTISETLEKAKKLNDIGGRIFVAELASETATSKNWQAYAGIVLEHQKARKVQTLAVQMQHSTADDLPGFIDQLTDIATTGAQSIIAHSLPKLAEVEQSKRDWLISDWLPAHTVTLFSGEGGVGKSRLMLQIVGKIALDWQGHAWGIKRADVTQPYGENRRRVMIASWEDDAMETGRRIIHAQSDLGWMDYEAVRDHVQIFDMRGRGPIWGVGETKNMNSRPTLLPTGFQVLAQAQTRWCFLTCA